MHGFKISSLPYELRYSVLSRTTIRQAVQFTQVNKLLRDYCLKHGPFPRKLDTIDVVFAGNQAKMSLSTVDSSTLVNLTTNDEMELVVIDGRHKAFSFRSPYLGTILGNFVKTPRAIVLQVTNNFAHYYLRNFFERLPVLAQVRRICNFSLSASYSEVELILTNFLPHITNILRLSIEDWEAGYEDQTNLLKFVTKQKPCQIVQANPGSLYRIWESLVRIDTSFFLFPELPWNGNHSEVFEDVIRLILKAPKLRVDQTILFGDQSFANELEDDESILSSYRLSRYGFSELASEGELAAKTRDFHSRITFPRRDRQFLLWSPKIFNLSAAFEHPHEQAFYETWTSSEFFYSKPTKDDGDLVLMIRFERERRIYEENSRMKRVAMLKYFPKSSLA